MCAEGHQVFASALSVAAYCGQALAVTRLPEWCHQLQTQISCCSSSKAMTDSTSTDLAAVLAAEFEGWLRNLSSKGVILRTFTGVTANGSQVTLILSGLPLTRVQRRDFLIWLCRTQRFVAYAYASHVGIFNEDGAGGSSEGINIYASSDLYDVSKALGVTRLPDGTHELTIRYDGIAPAGSSDCVFLGLQRRSDSIAPDDEALFRDLWTRIKPKSLWRQRASSSQGGKHGLN